MRKNRFIDLKRFIGFVGFIEDVDAE